MKTSLHTMQIVNYIGDYALRIQHASWNKRKVSIVSTQEKELEFISLPQATTLTITTTPYSVVTRAYKVRNLEEQRVQSREHTTAEEYSSESDYETSPTTYTLRYILENILSIDIEHYSRAPLVIIHNMMKEFLITERFIQFSHQHLSNTYEKEEIDIFLLYLLQCDSKEKDKLLELSLTDIPLIFTYIPPQVFTMLISYQYMFTFVPTVRFPPLHLSYSLRKKNIRLLNITSRGIPSPTQLYLQHHSYTHHNHITHKTPPYNQDIYHIITLYFPTLITLVCLTQHDSLKHQRYLLILYSIVLYYCVPDYMPISIQECIYSLYQEDIAFLEYIEKENISPHFISFAIAMEHTSNIHAQQHIYENGKDNHYISFLLTYGLFWIALLNKTPNIYSPRAFRIMISLASSFPTLKFFVFERLYTIACSIENYDIESTIVEFFTDSDMRKAIEYLPEKIFREVIESLSSITNKKSFLLILQKRFLDAYHLQ